MQRPEHRDGETGRDGGGRPPQELAHFDRAQPLQCHFDRRTEVGAGVRARRAAHQVRAQHLARLGRVAQSSSVDKRGSVVVTGGLVEHVAETDPDPKVEPSFRVAQLVDRRLEHRRVLQRLPRRRERDHQAIALPPHDFSAARFDEVGGDGVVGFAEGGEVDLAHPSSQRRRPDDVAEDDGHRGLGP